MKIFFVSSKVPKLFKGKYVLPFCFITLTLALLTSQLVSHIKNISQPVSGQTIAQSGFSVILDISGTLPAEGAMILVNGEEYAPLKSPSVQVELDRSSVIEVFSEQESGISVSARPSEGTTVIMSDDKVDIKKGMNYICRAFFAG